MAISEKPPAADAIPPLEQGDVLTRAEFERRYAAMPEVKKAELIEGTVHMSSPVRTESHGVPHIDLATLFRIYSLKHPELIVTDNPTVRLDALNEPQPDLVLMRRDGSAKLDTDDYISGPPELVAEIAASSASKDLHYKKRAYLRAGVLEYLVWITLEKRIAYWQLLDDDYAEITADDDGLLASPNFPGLVIDPAALIAGDLSTALSRLR